MITRGICALPIIVVIGVCEKVGKWGSLHFARGTHYDDNTNARNPVTADGG